MTDRLRAGLRRLARGFISGGLGSVALLLQSGVQVKDLAELQNLAMMLASAFVVGGLLALEKMYRWQN